jgi:hypothetical protein
VWVVKTLPPRVAHSAVKKSQSFAAAKQRARSMVASAAWPSFRWQTVDVEAQRFEGAPAADAEHALLHQPRLPVAGVELGSDAAVERRVERVVAVEQVERHPADVGAPDAHAQVAARQFDGHPQWHASLSVTSRTGSDSRELTA